MDDFFSTRHDPFRRDPFFDDYSTNYHRQFQNPFFIMSQMNREMDEMMRHAFNNLNQFESIRQPFYPQYPSIEQNQQQKQITNKDQDLDNQIQKYGLENVLNDESYLSEWDFVKQLQKEKPLNQPNPNMHYYYGRSNIYTYRSDGTGRIEERKMVQDSKGNRMESIKKQLDDKIWAKSVRRTEKGEIDEDEKLINMDDAEKEKFINEWKSNRDNKYIKSIDFTNNNKPIKIDNEMNPTHVTLPSLESNSKQDKNSNGKNWYDKLKFWK